MQTHVSSQRLLTSAHTSVRSRQQSKPQCLVTFTGLRRASVVDNVSNPSLQSAVGKAINAAAQRSGVKTVRVTRMMFERFTEKAIKVVMLAQEEARRLGHNFVGTEQILLGLIGESTGKYHPCDGTA
jgi:hypothetical protein